MQGEQTRGCDVSADTAYLKKEPTERSQPRAFTLRIPVLCVLGFSLYLGWIFCLFWSPSLFPAGTLGDLSIHMVRMAMTVAMFVAYVAFGFFARFFASRRGETVLRAFALVLCPCGCVVGLFPQGLGLAWCLVLWAASGIGSSALLLVWSKKIVELNRKQVIFTSSSAFLAGSFFFVATAFMPPSIAFLSIALLPVASVVVACLDLSPALSFAYDEQGSPQASSERSAATASAEAGTPVREGASAENEAGEPQRVTFMRTVLLVFAYSIGIGFAGSCATVQEYYPVAVYVIAAGNVCAAVFTVLFLVRRSLDMSVVLAEVFLPVMLVCIFVFSFASHGGQLVCIMVMLALLACHDIVDIASVSKSSRLFGENYVKTFAVGRTLNGLGCSLGRATGWGPRRKASPGATGSPRARRKCCCAWRRAATRATSPSGSPSPPIRPRATSTTSTTSWASIRSRNCSTSWTLKARRRPPKTKPLVKSQPKTLSTQSLIFRASDCERLGRPRATRVGCARRLRSAGVRAPLFRARGGRKGMSEVKTKHRSKLGTKATLLLCACDSNALGSEMTPILAVIALAFPGENVNLLVALPPLCIIPASLLAAKLSYHISRKTILTVGQILFIIGGIGGAFAPNFEFLLATRVFFGLGCGLVYPIVPTLISYFFAGQERVSMMGGANAVGSIIAMVFSTLSGTLAVIGWHVPFFVNVFFVFVLVMQIVFLPKVPPEKDMAFAKKADSLSPQQKRIGSRAWMGILLMFVSMTIGMVYLLKMAIFIQETGIGDSVMAGLASSSTTFTALVVSLAFSLIFKGLKRYTVLLSMASIALSFTLLAFATSPVGVFAGAVVYGVYLGTIIPYLQTSLSGLVHPYRRTYALSILSMAMFAGQACSSVYVSLVEGVIGPSTAALFQVMSGMFILLFVIVLVYLLATRKNAAYPYGDVTE